MLIPRVCVKRKNVKRFLMYALHIADYLYICGAILHKTLFLKVMKKEYNQYDETYD